MELRLLLKNKTIIYAQMFFVLVMLWLRDVLHFPSAISYITDVLLLFLVFTSLYGKNKFNILRTLIPQYAIVLAIVICMLFGAIINYVEPMLVLWGFRNNLRFFLFFFVCVNLLDASDIPFVLVVFKKFFWANAIMCAIQYFVFGLQEDYLGGFFGIERGCNAYLNVFICMICAIVLADFYVGKMKTGVLALYLVTSLALAFGAGLKIFYVELILIVVFVVILFKPSLKTVIICILSLLVLSVALALLYTYDFASFYLLVDGDALEYYIAGEGYTNSGDLNRFTAIEQIQKTFFRDDKLLSLFGFGLGSCEYSQYSFLQSDFFKIYGSLNYRWFTHAWVFLEQGMIGLLLLVSFFVRTSFGQSNFLISSLSNSFSDTTNLSLNSSKWESVNL